MRNVSCPPQSEVWYALGVTENRRSAWCRRRRCCRPDPDRWHCRSIALSATEKRGVEQRNLAVQRGVQFQNERLRQTSRVGDYTGSGDRGKRWPGWNCRPWENRGKWWSGKVHVALRIEHHRQRYIGCGSADITEISRLESTRRAGIENSQKDISRSREGGVGVGAVNERHVAAVGGPGDV